MIEKLPEEFEHSLSVFASEANNLEGPFISRLRLHKTEKKDVKLNIVLISSTCGSEGSL